MVEKRFQTKGLIIKVTTDEDDVSLLVFDDGSMRAMGLREAKRHLSLLEKAVEYATKEKKRLKRLKYKRQSRAAVVE